MNSFQSPNMMVALSEVTVARLMAEYPNKIIDDAVQLAMDQRANQSASLIQQTPPCPAPKQRPESILNSKYQIGLLDQIVTAANLGEVFAKAVDFVNDLDPAAIERLALRKLNSRYHVSRKKNGVCPGRRHLPVMQTKSGWWISKNVSQQQTICHLKALCDAAGLCFKTDIKFPI